MSVVSTVGRKNPSQPQSRQSPILAGGLVSVTGSATFKHGLGSLPIRTVGAVPSGNAAAALENISGGCDIKDNGDGTLTLTTWTSGTPPTASTGAVQMAWSAMAD